MCDVPDSAGPAALSLKQQAADAFSQGRLPEAVQALTSALAACPPGDAQLLSTLHCNRSACHAESGALTQALVDAKLAARSLPCWHKPYLRQALALTAMQRHSEAIAALEAGIQACSSGDAGTRGVGAQVIPGTAAATLPEEGLHGRQGGGVQLTEREAQVRELEEAKAALQAAAAAEARAAKRRRLASQPPAAAPSDPAAEAVKILESSGIEPRRVPVTVISGFLGAGKTTLLRHLLKHLGQRHSQGQGMLEQGQGQGQGSALGARQGDQEGQVLVSGSKQPRLGALPQASGGKQSLGSSMPKPAVRRAPLVGVLVNDLAEVNIDAQLLSDALQPPAQPPGQGLGMGQGQGQGQGQGMGQGQGQGQGQDNVSVAAHTSASTPAAQQPPGAANGHTSASTTLEPAADGAAAPAQAQLVELHGGCICCNLKGDMLLSVARLLTQHPSLQLLLIESTGVGDPMPVAAALQVLESPGYVKVDTLVTVADVCQLACELGIGAAAATAEASLGGGETQCGEGTMPAPVAAPASGQEIEFCAQDAVPPVSALANQGRAMGDAHPPHPPMPAAATAAAAAAQATDIQEAASEGQQGTAASEAQGHRPLAELLAQQVEYASVVVLNKCDLAASHFTAARPLSLPAPPAQVPTMPSAATATPATSTKPPLATSAAAAAAAATEQQLVTEVTAAVAALAPHAVIVHATNCQVEPELVLWTGRFDSERMEESARWQQELLAADGQAIDTGVEGGSTIPAGGAEGLMPGAGRSSSARQQTSSMEAGGQRQGAAGSPTSGAAAPAVPLSPQLAAAEPLAAAAHASEEEEYGISSISFAARRPFHPTRLWQLVWGSCPVHTQAQRPGTSTIASTCQEHSCGRSFVAGEAQLVASTTGRPGDPALVPGASSLPPGLLRAKGFFWVAGLPQVAWEWSTAGRSTQLTPYGEWLAPRLPRHLWPADRQGWDREWGDRKQVLVFIGRHMDARGLRERLEACLVSDEEAGQLLRLEGLEGCGQEDAAKAEAAAHSGGFETNAVALDRGLVVEGSEQEAEEAQQGEERWGCLAEPWRSLVSAGEQEGPGGRCYNGSVA